MLYGNKSPYILKQTCKRNDEILQKTLHFSGFWMFPKKWDNETMIKNIALLI